MSDKNLKFIFIFLFWWGYSFLGGNAVASPKEEEQVYSQYTEFFEQVYQTMDENYYLPVTRPIFDRFLRKFDEQIYPGVEDKSKVSDYVKWRSAAYLVDFLKSGEDVSSGFYPPKFAEQFESKVLGKRFDLGIEGELSAEGYIVLSVEPRSDAYRKGLRPQDVILRIDSAAVTTLSLEEIQERLIPPENTTVILNYRSFETREEETVTLLSGEYFKQTVFAVPVDAPGVFCLAIKSFNRKTSEDMFRMLSVLPKDEMTGLILDLRDNPGGPPLAAREISSFFLTPDEELAYFQKKGHPKALLKVPEIPVQYRYTGPIVILVNEKSGSAAELFSGVLQRQQRAVLMGKNTAGRVLLKSMFHLEDGSMLLLVTSRGYFPDGTVFSFKGVVPDRTVDPGETDLIQLAAQYLIEQDTSSDKRK